MKNNFEAKWSGSYPNLCSGRWTITCNGKMLSLPVELETSSMNTYIHYQSWHFEDWQEVFVDEAGGQHFDDWVFENHYWIDKAFDELGIERVEENYQDLYTAIQASDWSGGSCGGCI